MPARSSRPVAARLLSLALVTLVALALTGCNQLSAKRNLSRLENILSEIMVHQEADAQGDMRFRVQETLDLQSAVQNISDLVAREQYEQAAELAKRRMETAPGLLDAVIQDHAGFNRNRAEEDIRIAQDNDGQVLNQELWAEIMQHRESMNEANAEQNWGRVIEHGQRITDGVITLLQPLRNEANSLYETAITRMEEFEIYDASFHASDLVSESQTSVARVGELIGLRKYRQAISAAEEALTTISETIIESMASIAYIGITEIEGLTAEILEHGGEFRLGQRYRNFSEDWDALLGFFFNGEYRQALAQIRVLRPIAQRLVVDSYQLEAEEFIDLREEEISQLEDAEVRTYLPGAIDVAIELNTQADQTYQEGLATVAEVEGMDDSAFVNPDRPELTRESVLLEEARPIFAEAVELATDAGEEVDTIHRDFRELSETHLADAQTELNEAVRLRDRLEQISDVRIEMAIDEVDRRFLENRETEIGSIEQDLESAQIRKAMGEFRLSEDPPRYNTAIELANQSRAEAVAVQDAIYTIATRYSLIELAWMIDHYEREGAGEYVTPELDRTRRLLEDTRGILADGNPREAISRAADTRAQLEIMIQSLRRVANEEIQELRRLQGETENMLEQINAPERLELIAAQLTAAENHARNGDLKDAIETAQRGQRLAMATTTEAAREWAQTEIEDARARIGHAEDAGASQYAAATLQDARDLLDTARRRFETDDFLNSQLAAAESGMRADEARLALISDAEEALVRARDYDAWDFSDEELVDAQVAATRAIRYMDQGNFRESQQLARASANRAGDLTNLAKQMIYRDRVANLRRSIEHAINTGSTYFQPEELESVLDDLAVIERDYNIANHDDFVRDLEALETRMALVIEATPAVLEATLDSYRQWVRRLRDEEGAELYAQDPLREVANDILAAERSFENGHHRVAYRHVLEAGHTLQTIQLQADEFAYKAQVDDLLDQLAGARRDFSPFTSITPRMMTYMAIQPGGAGNATAVASHMSPTEFRREAERLQTLANQINPPPSRVDQHQVLLASLENAERAARNFEYLLIADRMDEHTIRDTVESAYLYLETSTEQSQDITQALIEGPLQGPVTMTEMGRPFVERAEANQGEGFFYGDEPRLWY